MAITTNAGPGRAARFVRGTAFATSLTVLAAGLALPKTAEAMRQPACGGETEQAILQKYRALSKSDALSERKLHETALSSLECLLDGRIELGNSAVYLLKNIATFGEQGTAIRAMKALEKAMELLAPRGMATMNRQDVASHLIYLGSRGTRDAFASQAIDSAYSILGMEGVMKGWQLRLERADDMASFGAPTDSAKAVAELRQFLRWRDSRKRAAGALYRYSMHAGRNSLPVLDAATQRRAKGMLSPKQRMRLDNECGTD